MVMFRTIQYKSIHFVISTFWQILCLIYFLNQPVLCHFEDLPRTILNQLQGETNSAVVNLEAIK